MFEKKRLTFYYCTTPLHMGAGTAVGAIDNPIQREVHSNHPVINGSGIKGAVRHHLLHSWGDSAQSVLKELFGAESGADELHAGAVSFTDAQLVAFPVRSLKETFVYVTCPYALGRLKRLAVGAGEKADWSIPSVKQGQTMGSGEMALSGDKLFLEAFEFSKTAGGEARAIAAWIAGRCFPDTSENAFFREKANNDLFIINDTDFAYFVRHATVVEPHVRIDDNSGTAADGALFYTENLPPESILAGLVLASIERTKDKASGDRRSAEDALKLLFAGNQGGMPGIGGTIVQMGGDATTGRGLVLVQPSGKEN